jgi:hypothetical protein
MGTRATLLVRCSSVSAADSGWARSTSTSPAASVSSQTCQPSSWFELPSTCFRIRRSTRWKLAARCQYPRVRQYRLSPHT